MEEQFLQACDGRSIALGGNELPLLDRCNDRVVDLGRNAADQLRLANVACLVNYDVDDDIAFKAMWQSVQIRSRAREK